MRINSWQANIQLYSVHPGNVIEVYKPTTSLGSSHITVSTTNYYDMRHRTPDNTQ